MSMMMCEANEYGDCCGLITPVEILFSFKTFKGRYQEDEIFQKNICDYHREWLEKVYGDTRFEMRGEDPDYAIHDDLFQPFQETSKIYTLVFIERKTNDDENDISCKEKYAILQGKNPAHFESYLKEMDDKILNLTEKGVFQTCYKNYESTLIELQEITDELALDVLANGLDHAFVYNTNEKYNPFKFYATSALPPEITQYFIKKKEHAEYKNFEECIEFIEENISKDLFDWASLRAISQHTTDLLLFRTMQRLINALLNKDDTDIQEMFLTSILSADVLWVTYILVNHELFWPADRTKRNMLQYNIRFIKLFIEMELSEKLLLLAISGERKRDLTIHARDDHNILYENEFVVQTLVPQYISPSDILIKYEDDEDWLTPLDYFNAFDNRLYSISAMSPCNSSFHDEPQTFKKNNDIKVYLEKCVVQEINENALKNERTLTIKEKAFCEEYENDQKKRDAYHRSTACALHNYVYYQSEYEKARKNY